MSTVEAKTAQKWIAGDAGPIQIGRVSKALSNVRWAGSAIKEIRDYGESVVHRLGLGASEQRAEVRDGLVELGERFSWTVTRANANEVVRAAEELAAKIMETMPVEDKRSTEEERAARAKRDEELQAKHAEVLRTAAERKAYWAGKIPGWANALIVAELREDKSDMMTDYFGYSTERTVLIGFRRGAREDFRQLRAAAGRYEPTKHLGLGCDAWTVRVWTEPKTEDPHGYRASEGFHVWEGEGEEGRRVTTWPTEAEARAVIEGAIARDKAKSEAVPFEPYSPEASDAAVFGYELVCESVEHRENYSMGKGNYLGLSGYGGWVVRSRGLDEIAGCEDGLPTTPDWIAVEGGSEELPEGNGSGNGLVDPALYAIQKHRHTKKDFDFWLVVLGHRVERDEFERLRESCKTDGGWYSRQWGKTPGGFAFDSFEGAKAWAVANVKGVGGPTADADAAE